MAGRLMLEHVGIAYKRIDLLPAIHKPVLRLLGFPGTTVPALTLNHRRIQGTLAISRVLGDLQLAPPLYPIDGQQRARVEQAERWGEAALQPVPRRLTWWALARDRDALRSFAAGVWLHVPLGLTIKTAGPIIAVEQRLNHADDATVRDDLAHLPQLLDHVDDLLATGTIVGQPWNAADYQIATSVRLLLCFEDVRPVIEARPSGTYAHRVVETFPGCIRAVIPPAWLHDLWTD